MNEPNDYSYEGCGGDVFLMGQRARAAGLDRDQCGFEDFTPQSDKWKAGWDEANGRLPDQL